MLEKLQKLKEKNNSIKEFAECVRQGIPVAVFGVNDAFKYFLTSVVDRKVLYVVKDTVSMAKASEQILQFSHKNVICVPPKDEVLVMAKAFSKDSIFARVNALYNMANADIVVTTVETLMQTVPKKIECLHIKQGGEINRDELVSTLISFGYKRVERVEDKATFSLRGDVIDVSPINTENPIRIDFFADEIESLKFFDMESRESLGLVKEMTVVQACEFIIESGDYELAKTLIKREISNADNIKRSSLQTLADEIQVAIEIDNQDSLSIISSVCQNRGDFFEYLSNDFAIIIDEAKPLYDVAILYEREFNERFTSLEKTGEIFSFEKNNLIGVESLKEKINNFRVSTVQALSSVVPFFNPLKIINPQVSGVADYRLDFKELFTDVSNWLINGYRILLSTGDLKRAENLSIDFSEHGLISNLNDCAEIKGLCITSETLSSGFVFHEEKMAVIGSGNLFAKPISSRKLKVKRQSFFSAPERGDYCVHEIHGVGRVIGNKKITTSEGTKDYISVEYYGGDVLHIPVEQMDILTRYLGSESHPKLSKIGGIDFEKVKNAVKESLRRMSFDLKKLYEERNAQKGFKFVCDEELENAFASMFPYEETPDQETCDIEIKEDMSSDKVMDRLVCGDVGFGKTEVAFRAVFRAVVNGKQVAMLAPTTILTEQHYNTAVERFKGFGVKIAVLNRFKSVSQQKKIINNLKNGGIDFVIGTHRLLSKDIGFKDLGLLILDEEQRFGVEHKEKIKLLKKNVDTLTLTATPIPRTLHLSLSGIRSISTINTPPKKRLPVQTYVTEESESLIRDAIMREVNRGGQAFILYNRIESIFAFEKRLEEIMPAIKFTVIHGRMDEQAMERGIIDFYENKTNVLVSTTIIENGIDLPKANTLIVIDADNLGLSTLYQLKGRVGRSDRLAYAYFTYKKEKIISSVAFDRLNAIIEFAEMGSGIKIAMRDLEIRGAGNILGAEQHGHMDKIGYELYAKLLREELTGEEERVIGLDIRVSAFIPESYIEGETSRMDAYKAVAEIDSIKAEQEFIAETENVYGKIPEELKNLIDIAIVKSLASKLQVDKIVIKRGEVSLSFNDFSIFSNEQFSNALGEYEDNVKVSMIKTPKIFFGIEGKTNEESLKELRKFLSVATDMVPNG